MDEDTLTVWLDNTLLMLGGFVLLAIMLLAAVNPKVIQENDPPPGGVVIEAVWASGSAADVDLWAQAPGDKPVGYSNKNGKVFNLLRDDRGKAGDLTDINAEISMTRGTPAGEYVANVHLYDLHGDIGPVGVTIVARARTKSGSTYVIASTKVVLETVGQEITALRFRLDELGNLVPDSINHLQKPLRNAS